MVIKPKIRGFICTNAHPVGCAEHVQEQINYVKAQGPLSNAPKNVLVIGASTGYGLASRITAAFGGGANTLGIFFEKKGQNVKQGLLAGTTPLHSPLRKKLVCGLKTSMAMRFQMKSSKSN
ncbi:hypothetical protein [Pseudoalteromonas lipolytica]|uniref:hypothetical protein n=1 Tax=Pseudoalteromonas lipolytica TaxID=570156 RepID=UPI003A982E9B